MILDQKLKELNACVNARDWANGKTWEEIHRTCHRGDWLLWLFKKTNPDKLRELTLAKAHCAATVLHLMTDERSKNAITVAIKYGNNEATSEELKAAAADAYTAADAAADAADAAYTADAAAYYAAAYAAAAAYTAADAADTAADAAAYAAAALIKNQLHTADICRQFLPIEMWELTN